MSKTALALRHMATFLSPVLRSAFASQGIWDAFQERTSLEHRRRFQTTPLMQFRGPKFRVYNEDRDLPLTSSDDEDRQPRKYVFVSDDDERLFDEFDEEETDDDVFYEASSQQDPINDALWAQIEASPKSPVTDPEQHFAEWQKRAKAQESVQTEGLTWANTALEMTRDLISAPPFDALTLHTFRIDARRRQVCVTLDKYVDAYGSPSLEEISSFTEVLSERMCESLGNAVMESLKFEVSSPGAERRVRLPFELSRFDHLPMKVCHRTEDDTSATKILEFQRQDGEMSVWKYWKGKFNRKMTKLRNADFVKEIRIPLKNLLHVHLFLDV